MLSILFPDIDVKVVLGTDFLALKKDKLYLMFPLNLRLLLLKAIHHNIVFSFCDSGF